VKFIAERDRDAGAAEVDELDQGVGAVKAEGVVADQADLGVEAFQAAVGESEATAADAVAVAAPAVPAAAVEDHHGAGGRLDHDLVGMRRGGVGWYPNSRFVHLDSGPVRNWSLGEQGLGRLLLDNKPSPYFPDNV